MQPSLASRKLPRLTRPFHRDLSSYALTAAFLVSFLGLAMSAEARVVYTQTNVSVFGTGSVELDLNHDGISDFTIKLASGQIPCQYGGIGVIGDVTISPAKNAGVVASGMYASVLEKGVQIDSGQTFDQGETTMVQLNTCSYGGYQHGDWYPVFGKYLGLTGRTRYGWAQLSVYTHCDIETCALRITLSGFAYETVAGRGIKAGQTQDDLDASPDSAGTDDASSGASLMYPAPDGSFRHRSVGIAIHQQF